jgi:Glycosyltransferases, probably involved in cell wall biogenesis
MKKPKMNRQYIVVTPCRNEEKNLPNLVQSIAAQTIKPALWVIVDDGSTDKTGEIIAEAEKRYEWIKGVHLRERKEYMGAHLAYVCNKGFGFARAYCNERGRPYAYIALVDADNILEVNYFEKLIEEFEKDEQLGIASGNSTFADIEIILDDLRARNQNVTVTDKEFWQLWDDSFAQIKHSRVDLPMGSARLWRRACFEETGGYLPVSLPDSVSNAKAKMKGWKTKRFMNIKIIERQGLIKQGLWDGYKEKGESLFFLGQPLYFAVLRAFNLSLKKPYYTGMAYLYGYIKSLVLRNERVNDDEIRKYFHFIHHDYYKKKFRRMLRK